MHIDGLQSENLHNTPRKLTKIFFLALNGARRKLGINSNVKMDVVVDVKRYM